MINISHTTIPVFKLLLLAAASSLLSGCYVAPNIGNEELYYAADDEILAQGKTLYEAYCFSCHGADLKGTGPDALKQVKPPADLTAKSFHLTQTAIKGVLDYPHYSHETIQDKIKYGNEVMPPLGDVLDSKEIESITQYISITIRKSE
jgi:mono/diheme cytochrome c family protein